MIAIICFVVNIYMVVKPAFINKRTHKQKINCKKTYKIIKIIIHYVNKQFIVLSITKKLFIITQYN